MLLFVGSSAFATLKWDAVIFSLIGLVFGLIYYQKNLPLKHANHEERKGTRPPDRLEGDTLLLIPNTPAKRAKNFSQLDCTYGWFNTLRQEVGAFGTALTKNFSPELLSGRQLVVVPKQVIDIMPSNGIDVLKNYVERGGNLILSSPTKEWGKLSGLKPKSTAEAFNGLSVEPDLYHPDFVTKLPSSIRVRGKRIELENPAQGRVLVEDNHKNALLTLNSVGKGDVLNVLFNIACLQSRLHQGPFEVTTENRQGPFVPTENRMDAPAQKTSNIPTGDFIENIPFAALREANEPLPVIWRHPETYLGTLTQSIIDVGPKHSASVLTKWMAGKDIPNTVFRTPKFRQREISLNEDIPSNGLLWRRHRDIPTQDAAIGGAPLFRTELNLSRQIRSIQTQYTPSAPVTFINETRWTRSTAKTFRQLNGAGIKLDHSYGPTSTDRYGFVFGTNYPFFPLDHSGLPIPTMELPFQLNGANLTPNRVDKLLRGNASFFHGIASIVIPSDMMANHPSGKRMQAILKASENPPENQWLADLEDVIAFQRARQKSVLASSWNPDTKRLQISANLKEVEDHPNTSPSILLPARIPSGKITNVTSDGTQIPPSDIKKLPNRHYSIIGISAGSHEVVVQYD